MVDCLSDKCETLSKLKAELKGSNEIREAEKQILINEIEINAKLKAENERLDKRRIELCKKVADYGSDNERLRKAIFTAPHNMGCSCLQGGPTLPNWGKLEFCDCWKKAALREVEK